MAADAAADDQAATKGLAAVVLQAISSLPATELPGIIAAAEAQAAIKGLAAILQAISARPATEMPAIIAAAEARAATTAAAEATSAAIMTAAAPVADIPCTIDMMEDSDCEEVCPAGSAYR